MTPCPAARPRLSPRSPSRYALRPSRRQPRRPLPERSGNINTNNNRREVGPLQASVAEPLQTAAATTAALENRCDLTSGDERHRETSSAHRPQSRPGARGRPTAPATPPVTGAGSSIGGSASCPKLPRPRVRAQVIRVVGSCEEPSLGQIPFAPRADAEVQMAAVGGSPGASRGEVVPQGRSKVGHRRRLKTRPLEG
jgi:hypothetical protein